MKALVTLVLFLSAHFAWAEAHYPPPPDIRPEGMQQGTTGSCLAEAVVAAMEFAFQVRGYGVLLSTFNAHAFNKQQYAGDPEIKQEYTSNDVKIFNHFGRYVPYYMLPEDGRGYVLYSAGSRPPVSELGVYDFSFPSAAETGQTEASYAIAKGAGGIEQLKNFVRQQQAAVLSLQGGVLGKYDSKTGFLKDNETYHYETIIPKDRDRDVDHAVALVGFDDSLVAGKGVAPGAFIVRNSWNESDDVHNGKIHDVTSGTDQEKFLSFRGKINPATNDLGYFAIPYQYILDLANNGGGVISIYGINFTAFSNAYHNFENKYKVRMLPFTCDVEFFTSFINRTYPAVLNDFRSADPAKRGKAMSALTNLFSESKMASTDLYHVAKIAQFVDNDSPVHDFYKGKYESYYCGSGVADFGPKEDILKRPDFTAALNMLDVDDLNLSAWLYTFKSLYLYLGENK
jgi:hypothetical protein